MKARFTWHVSSLKARRNQFIFILNMHFRELKRRVIERLSTLLVISLLSHVRSYAPQLWGQIQPNNYLEGYVYITLYKDLVGVGKAKLANLFRNRSLGFPVNHRTLQHNVEVLRPLFADWAKTIIKLGTSHDWDVASRRVAKYHPDLQVKEIKNRNLLDQFLSEIWKKA